MFLDKDVFLCDCQQSRIDIVNLVRTHNKFIIDYVSSALISVLL